MMSGKEAHELDGDSNELAAVKLIAAHLAAAANSHTHTPPPQFSASSFASLKNTQQFPFLDPNVLMMNNAAATIAAVAASVQNQMGQGNQSTQSSGGGGTTSPNASALLNALRGSNSSISPQILAALLGGGGSSGGGHSHSLSGTHSSQTSHHIPSQTSHLSSQLHSSHSSHLSSQLHPALKSSDSSALRPATSQAAAAISSAAILPGMQKWSCEQLEQHVNRLNQLNQPVPQSVALLLADAKRKEKKKTAKRAANRKSASTSRARKKALVEEMTRTNARLKRQALILALLPDLVIVISTEGEITFCSDQVERILQHKIDDLLGAKLHSLLVPSSRDVLNGLIEGLVASEKSDVQEADTAAVEGGGRGAKRQRSNQQNSSNANESKNANENSIPSGSSGRDPSGAAVVSEPSFPLSVVEVDSKQARPAKRKAAGGNSDTSTSTSNEKPQTSSVTNSPSRSPTASSSEENEQAGNSRDSSKKRKEKGKGASSGDDSSSLSSEGKKMRTASENLDRNVRWHNQRMMEENNIKGPKDDVTGASVTANNATARLSSLQHVPAQKKEDENVGDQSSSDESLLAGVEEKKKRESASDDSGYRESNDSREETSSSGSETSNSNERSTKFAASTSRMCLIRNDLTTVWCEVTSSIRTKSVEEDGLDTQGSTLSGTESSAKTVEGKELLLCLRPIRDGEKKVDESFRFVTLGCEGTPPSSGAENVSASTGDNEEKKESSGSGSNSTPTDKSQTQTPSSNRPPKKRHRHASDQEATSGSQQKEKKKTKHNSAPQESDETEKSVVESLMLIKSSQ